MSASTAVSAQNGGVASFYYDEEIPGVTQAVSGNGQWAVGCDEGVVANNAFVWTRATGFVDVFGTDASGRQAQGTTARLYGVSNDGTAVGTYEDGTSSLATKPVRPGVFKDGTWTPLPTLVDIMAGDVNGYATDISADGRIICGHVPASIVTSEFMGNTITTVGPCVPVIWVDGEIQRVDDLQYEGYGAWVEDMSADGSVLCGYADFDDGSRSPAVFKDGQLIRLIGTTSATSDPDKWQEFFEGRMYALNAEGTRAAGYFAEGYGSIDGIVWDIPETITSTSVGEDEVEHVNGIPTTFDSNGATYVGGSMGGSSSVYVDGENISLADYLQWSNNPPKTPAAIMSVSDDAKTFATSFVLTNQMGQIQCPMVISFDGASGIGEATADGVGLSYTDNQLTITGEHGAVTVFTTGGTVALTAGGNASQIDLSSLAGGVYVVKVAFDGGHKVMKVLVD